MSFRAIVRRIRSFLLAFACFQTERVLAELLLEAQRMRAAGVLHTRAEWERLADVERAALIVAGGGDAPARSSVRGTLEAAAAKLANQRVPS